MQVRDLLADREKLPQKQFVEAHPHAVLVRAVDARSAESEYRTTVAQSMLPRPPRTGKDLEPQYVVMLLKKRPQGIFPERIGVGRTGANDIIVPDNRISKYHAYFEFKGEREGYVLTDASSRNGTSINGLRLQPGKATNIADGSTVDFGGLTMRFHTASGLYVALGRCAGSSRAPIARSA